MTAKGRASRIGVVGLGYVGLPLAVEFGKQYETIGFDVNPKRVAGLKFNRDFFAGYSPERINPGDREHRLTTIRKVTSGSTPEVADFVDELYGSIVSAGTHKTSSIRVAEAAKVIENTQRDVN